jgi:hypothetical protein
VEADAAALASIQQPAWLGAAADSPSEAHQPIEALAQALPNARTALVGGRPLIDPAGPEVIALIEEEGFPKRPEQDSNLRPTP